MALISLFQNEIDIYKCRIETKVLEKQLSAPAAIQSQPQVNLPNGPTMSLSVVTKYKFRDQN